MMTGGKSTYERVQKGCFKLVGQVEGGRHLGEMCDCANPLHVCQSGSMCIRENMGGMMSAWESA